MEDGDRLRALESALQHSERLRLDAEQRLNALSDSYPLGIYHCDAGGARTHTNRCGQEISGRGADAELGDGWMRFLHPDDAPAVAAAWESAVQGGRDFDREFRIVRASGEIRVVRSRACAIGSPCSGFVGALEDVTALRDGEERLRASEAFLGQTGRIAGVGGWEVDLLTGMVNWSQQTRVIHEVAPDYRPTVADGISFYATQARPVIEAAVNEALTQGTSWDLELPFVSAKGRSLWVRTFGEPQYEGGQLVRLIGAFQDITEHRARQAALEREKALRQDIERHAGELDRLLTERGEMLDVMAHEVRQPLNNASAALQSAAAALRDVGENAASLRVTRAQTVMAQVLASIDNTLAVAALLARPGPIQYADTDIDTLIAVSVNDLPPTERSRIRIDRITQTRTASMDMSLMRLALRNLLSNALKYSPARSEVVVQVSDSDEPLALVLDVIDAGSGIPAEILPRLFTRGARGTHAGMPPGHGLGLYIVRRVMELHAGRVEVVRNGPDGVTFRLWVNLPPD